MKAKRVKVSLPVNHTKEDEFLFINSLSYELPTLKIKKLKNVLVTYTGFCLTEKGLVKESHHDYPYQYKNYLSEAYYYFYLAKDDPNKLIMLDNKETYLLIHHPWFNYYHWLTEVIPRLLLVKETSANMILLLPDYYKSVDFIMSSLKPFSFKDIFFIPKNNSLLIESLCMPQIKPICASHDKDVLNNLKNIYLDYVLNKLKINRNFGSRIYISRQKATQRKVVNEEAVIDLVKEFDFVVIHCEDFTFFEQVAIFSNASLLVSIHGAGLTNMLFMKKNSSIMEMHKKITNENDHYSLTLWYLADALGYNYFHQICEPTDYLKDYYKVNFVVDLDLLKKNLEMMVNS